MQRQQKKKKHNTIKREYRRKKKERIQKYEIDFEKKNLIEIRNILFF